MNENVRGKWINSKDRPTEDNEKGTQDIKEGPHRNK